MLWGMRSIDIAIGHSNKKNVIFLNILFSMIFPSNIFFFSFCIFLCGQQRKQTKKIGCKIDDGNSTMALFALFQARRTLDETMPKLSYTNVASST